MPGNQPGQLPRRARGEVAPPTTDAPERPRVEPQHGHVAERRGTLDASALPRDEPCAERARKPRLHGRPHRDQLRDVLARDVVGRHREGRLLPLALDERPAVGLREQREADGDDHEADGDRRVARPARQRERGETQRKRRPGNETLQPA